MKITNKKILVTGGATGIGFGLAERFVRDGNIVLICGRREDALAQAVEKIPDLITFACDLATEEGRLALFHWIGESHADLNVLVNNAGIQQWMAPVDANFYDRARVEIAINVEAPVHLSWLFSQLAELDTIMNVTSGLSFVPLTKTPVYSATKAFLHSFTWSMRHLLKTKNIEVVEIIPPALNTDLGGKGLHDQAPPVSGFIDSIFEQLEQGKTELTYGFSENMAKAGPDEIRQAFQRMNQAG